MANQDYTYAEHKFRFAAWAAARALIPNGIAYPPGTQLPHSQRNGALRNIFVAILRDVFFKKIEGKGEWRLKDEVLEDKWLLEISDFDIQHKN